MYWPFAVRGVAQSPELTIAVFVATLVFTVLCAPVDEILYFSSKRVPLW